MFDFEKLEVYKVARDLNKDVFLFSFSESDLAATAIAQWKKSSMAAVLYLSEGVGRMEDAEKRAAFTMSRSAVYECVTMIHLLVDLGQMDQERYKQFYDRYEQLSKMLLGMYRSKV